MYVPVSILAMVKLIYVTVIRNVVMASMRMVANVSIKVMSLRRELNTEIIGLYAQGKFLKMHLIYLNNK